jgi:hypothetical protein
MWQYIRRSRMKRKVQRGGRNERGWDKIKK